MNWQRHHEELHAGNPWHCPKCDTEHKTDFRIVRIIQGQQYQLWKGPHMICGSSSAEELQDYAETFSEGDLF